MNFISTGYFYEIFTYKLVTYLSTGDVTGLQNASFRGSFKVNRVNKVCCGIVRSYRVTARISVRVSWLRVASVDMICVRVCM